jgi:hypothetical protein
MSRPKGSVRRHPALAKEQSEAMTKLLGRPIKLTEQTTATDLERLALLAEHVQRLKHPYRNPYKHDFTKFRTELCWTKNESGAGRTALMPDLPYLRQVDRANIRFSPLMYEKARRMMFTWDTVALALWLIAGGHDPAWVDGNGFPILMPSEDNPDGRNRRVLFGAQKLEGLGGSHEQIDRLRFMVAEFEERGGREKWPDFPEFEWRFDQARASNGGVADAVAQGADQMRGPGATLVVADELAFWTEAKASIASAMQTLQGGGHFIAGSSSNVGSHAALIVKGEVNKQRSRLESARDRQIREEQLEGFDLIRLRLTPDGFYVASLPHTLRPDYDLKGVTQGLSEEDIQREIYMNWNASKGVRVYPSFRYEVHVAGERLPFDPDQPLHIGWDFGNEPACAITQLNALGQWQIFPGFHPEANEFDGIYSFAERVADHLLREYAAPNDMDVDDLLMVHIGDPAGAAPISQAKGRRGAVTTCFDILRRGLEIYQGEDEETGMPIYEKKPGWGWHLVKGATTIPGRVEAVRNRLNTLLDGYPALIVDPRDEFAISGFLGGYHYHEHQDGFINVREPKKDHFSHYFDALGYIASRLHARPAPKRDEDDEGMRMPPFISHASSAHRYG